MTREQYLEMRNNNELNLDLFYKYYLTHCKNPLINSLDEFIMFFGMYFNIRKELILTYFDNKFEVNKLINVKTQEIIKYV